MRDAKGFLLAAGLLMAVVAAVSLARPVLVTDVELDFTGNFAVEAQRILDGEPLQLNYHPPGYAFAVAFARLLTRSWMAAGLWLTGLSTVVFLLASAAAARRALGTSGAWGALVGCALSFSFLRFGTTASSDMYFAALCALSIALVLRAHDRQGPPGAWLLAGAVAGLAVLARTNGAVLLVALPIACLISAAPGTRLRTVAAAVAGMIAPLLLWAAYALATSSQLTPVGSHINLAVQAYGQGPDSFTDLSTRFGAQFDSTFAVIAHDPARMIVTFTKRLIALPWWLATRLAWLPVALLAIPGLVIAFRRKPLKPILIYFLLAGLLTLAVGFLGFKDRMHLLLIPVIGALAGIAIAGAIDRYLAGRARLPVFAAIGLVAVAVIYLNVGRLHEHRIGNGEPELAEAVSRTSELIEPDAILYARDSALSFQIGRGIRHLPDIHTAAELRALLCREVGGGEPAYLYVGAGERRTRAELMAEIQAPGTIAWLEPAAAGREHLWQLYRIRITGHCP